MANMSDLTRLVEPYVVQQLKQTFNCDLRKRKLTLVPGGVKQFAAVSDDGSIVCQIKYSSGLTRTGKVPIGRLNGLYRDFYFLLQVPAERRVVVLVDPAFRDVLNEHALAKGRIDSKIEIHTVDLPPELAEIVRLAQKRGSDEIDIIDSDA